MDIRTFKGPAIKVIMDEVRAMVGEDALIVDTRRLADRSVEIDVALTGTAPSRSAGLASKNYSGPAALAPGSAELLRAGGFSGELLERLVQRLGQSPSLADNLSQAFSSVCSFDSALLPRLSGIPKIVALVGPTGAGKTTTIAKLAAQLQRAFDLRIAFISADSFRIGAAHQLQTYAALLNIPCRCICPPGSSRAGVGMVERIDEALAEFQDHDLILVDTAGIGPRDRERLKLLEETIGAASYVERVLVLPAPGNERDLLGVAEAFAPLQYSRLILTKLDETSFCGPVLGVSHRLRLPFAYFCHGQRVPEDIEPATAARLAWMVTQRIH
jgi:flagellar biosynthesis protein FlhF